MDSTPPEIVINFDQTALNYVPIRLDEGKERDKTG